MAKTNTSSLYNPVCKNRVKENISTAVTMTLHNNKKARTVCSGFTVINAFINFVPVWVYFPVLFLFLLDNDHNASTTPV